jgi:hypothetical protein
MGLSLQAAVLLCLWPVTARAASCQAEVGAARAALYVKECLAITSATHPPCNAANPCAVIGQHIQYMCAQAGAQAPGWCRAYKTDAVPNPPPPLPRTARPGFDCAKATSRVDREICAPGNGDLAAADREMTKLYEQGLPLVSDPGPYRAAQLAFLRDRERCGASEPGRKPSDMALDHCIGVMTHYAIDALRSHRQDDLWTSDGPPRCTITFGDDGWDNITVSPAQGTVYYSWVDMREGVLRPTDTVAFDVDGAVFPGRIATDSDGQANALAPDPHLVKAMTTGDTLRVRRNGKVIFRALLADFPSAYAKTRRCAGAAK